MAGAGAIPALVAVLQAHMNEHDLTKNVLGALRMLANHKDTKVPMAAAGALPLILSALQTHGDSKGVVKAASGAIRNL